MRCASVALAFVVGSLAFPQSEHSWNQESIKTQIEQICEEWDVDDAPGGAVGVVHGGKLLFARGFGLANVELGVKNTAETKFDVGSVSKQFTVMCVLILEDRGELSIDDPVSKHFPDIPAAKNGMTIKQLMQHTSGIRDYFGLMALSGYTMFDDDDVMAVLNRQTDVNFKPGAAFLYSNTGYFLLAQLVEKISGEDFADFAEENVFKPLGMHDTVFQDDFRQLIMNKAYGYIASPEDGLLAGVAPLSAAGAGGVITTLNDMMLWTENWKRNKLGPQSMIERMHTKATLNSGDDSKYGLALFMDDLDGVKRVQHGGDFIGFHTQVSTFPEHDLAVYTFGNDGTQLAKSLNDEIARYLLADSVEKKDETADIELTEEELKEYEGRYDLAGAMIVEFSVDEGKLKTQATGQPKFDMFCSAKDEFYLKVVEATIVFNRDDDGKIATVTLTQSGQTFEMQPAAPYDLTPEDIRALTGRYYSPEMDAVLTVFEKDGEVWAKTDKLMEPTKVEMTAANRGSISIFACRFVMREGKATRIMITIPRSNNIRFKRMLTDWQAA